MIEKIKNNIFTAEGRLNRLKYFKYLLAFNFGMLFISFILSFIVGIVTAMLGLPEFIVSLFAYAISIPIAVGDVMLQIRRLHDLDKSGWFALLSLIPIINFCLGLYLLLFKGTEGDNRYGPDPLLNHSTFLEK